MRISGLQKVTLLDYPGHIACTIFLGMCNLRCPFCHNMDLVLHFEKFPEITIDEIMKFLKSRKGKLEGVAITGGEPLVNNDIENLIQPIKDMGYLVKLDTNGFFPEKLKLLLEKKMIDRVAMDIKAGYKNYLKVSGIANNENISISNWKEKVDNSISLIMNNDIDYEFRTTCVKGLHTDDDFYEIKEMIKGAKNYFLQNYNATNDMKNLPFKPFAKEELEHLKNIVKDNIKNVEIRGI